MQIYSVMLTKSEPNLILNLFEKHLVCGIFEWDWYLIFRYGQLLNLYWEKTPESVFYKAVESTVEDFSDDGVTLVDFTSTEDACLCDALGNAQFSMGEIEWI